MNKPKRTIEECRNNFNKVMDAQAKSNNRKERRALGILALDCLLGLK